MICILVATEIMSRVWPFWGVALGKSLGYEVMSMYVSPYMLCNEYVMSIAMKYAVMMQEVSRMVERL